MSTETLDKLRGKLHSSYKSTFFDNISDNFENEIKLAVCRQEEIFFNEFRKNSISLFQQCKALNEINKSLKKDGVFMEWCQHVKLSKDKTSELLKRYELYNLFPENHLWVSSLSILAVKILTNKSLEIEHIKNIAELELRSADEIKIYIAPFLISNFKDLETIDQLLVDNEDIISDFKGLKKKIKQIKNSENIFQYKNQIITMRMELEELEATIKIQEESIIL